MTQRNDDAFPGNGTQARFPEIKKPLFDLHAQINEPVPVDVPHPHLRFGKEFIAAIDDMPRPRILLFGRAVPRILIPDHHLLGFRRVPVGVCYHKVIVSILIDVGEDKPVSALKVRVDIVQIPCVGNAPDAWIGWSLEPKEAGPPARAVEQAASNHDICPPVAVDLVRLQEQIVALVGRLGEDAAVDPGAANHGPGWLRPPKDLHPAGLAAAESSGRRHVEISIPVKVGEVGVLGITASPDLHLGPDRPDVTLGSRVEDNSIGVGAFVHDRVVVESVPVDIGGPQRVVIPESVVDVVHRPGSVVDKDVHGTRAILPSLVYDLEVELISSQEGERSTGFRVASVCETHFAGAAHLIPSDRAIVPADYAEVREIVIGDPGAKARLERGGTNHLRGWHAHERRQIRAFQSRFQSLTGNNAERLRRALQKESDEGVPGVVNIVNL